MARRGEKLPVAAAALLLATTSGAAGQTPDRVNTIRDVAVRLYSCWRPPPPSRARPLDITVAVSFTRDGNILGHPKITYESAEASDNDRLQYRIAVMEALQRCTPMPFTDAMGGAVAGHPFKVPFHGRKTSPPTQERRA